MRRIPGIRHVVRLTRRDAPTRDADIDEELRFHLDMRIEELLRRGGHDEPSARREALRQFGDLDEARRYLSALDARIDLSTRRRELMHELRQDLRSAARALRRTPGFTMLVVAVLALGIGATTSVFTLVDALLLRPLPVRAPGALVLVGDPAMIGVTSGGPQRTDLFSHPLYVDLRDGTRSLSGLLAVSRPEPLEVRVPLPAGDATGAAPVPAETSGGATERAKGVLVSGNYFTVLGVPAALGRTLVAADDGAPGAGAVTVLSHAFWTRRVAADSGVLGRTLIVDGAPLTVVGVAAPGFRGETVGWEPDFWMPLAAQPLVSRHEDRLRDRTASWLLLIGRLAPGATRAQVGAELTAAARRSLADAAGGRLPDALQDARVDVHPGARGFSRARVQLRGSLLIVFAATGLVLLVVCANVTNLLLARAATRRGEVALRLAIGAGRLRLVRQLLMESLLMGAAAGALGLALTRVGVPLLARTAQASGTTLQLDAALDLRVFAFSTGLALLTAALVGLVPAVRGTRVALATTLRGQLRGAASAALGGGRRLGLGGTLVTGQVALSLVLLIGAGLFLRSVHHLQGTPLGMARDELLMVDVDLRASGATGARLDALCDALVARMSTVAGVRAATYSWNGLFGGGEGWTSVRVDGLVPRTADDTTVHFDRVGPGYFRTIGARLLRGRGVESHDGSSAAKIGVVNATMARFYFGTQDPIGRFLRVEGTPVEVVGVVADVTDHDLRAESVRRLYLPLAQRADGGPGSVVFAVRVVGDPARAVAAVRGAVRDVDPTLRLYGVKPLTALMEESIAQDRIVARLASVAGSVALLLATLGLYGVVTYAIVRRRGEFGVRLALGARPADVTRLVLRESLRTFALGAAIGVPLAMGLGRLVRHQLVGVGLVDVPITLGALAVVGMSALLAASIPARQAARLAPAAVLRDP